jgi:hypothetical protein
LAEQFDAVFHFDETRAVQPLDAVPEWEAGEAPKRFHSPSNHPTIFSA